MWEVILGVDHFGDYKNIVTHDSKIQAGVKEKSLLTRGRGCDTCVEGVDTVGACVRYTCERLGERPRLRIEKKEFL